MLIGTATSYKALNEQIGAKNSMQLCEMFINEVLIASTNKNAADNNYLSFITSKCEMKTLLCVDTVFRKY